MVMAKRQDAPGELERVRAFVNTVDLEPGEEQLTDPLALGAWLTDSGLASDLDPPSERDLRHAVELREALRAILLTHSGPSVADPAAAAILDQTARRARLGLRFDERGVGRLEPDSDGVDAALEGYWRSWIERSSTARGSGSRHVASIRARGPSTTTQRTGRARGATWPTAAIGPRQRPTGKGDQALTSVRRCRPSAATTDWFRTARSVRRSSRSSCGH